MNHLFVSKEISEMFDLLQFNERCLAFYSEDGEFILSHPIKNDVMLKGFTAPSYNQAIDWLREQHRIFVWVRLEGNSLKQQYVSGHIKNLNPNNTVCCGEFEEYYLALDKAITEALNLIK